MLALGVLAPAAHAQRTFETDGATGLEVKTLARARSHMIAAANPHAVDAGLAILRAGGSALDAAIAAQLVLGLVEPQSSGIGGGGFLLHWDQRVRRLRTYDGRETAPAAIAPDVFMGPDGKPRGFWDAVNSGESVGAPGLLRMLAMAHASHGKLPWPALFEPAIKLAGDGFAVSGRLNRLLAERGPERFDAAARAYFFDAVGQPRAVGEKLVNTAYASVLRQVADKGPDALHKGPVADAIVKAVAEAPTRGGRLSLHDLAGYAAKERPPVCASYQGFRICGMGPPSSGGIATAMTLRLLEPFSLGRVPMNGPALHLIAEAQKLAYADRDRWLADPDQVKIPAGMLDAFYLATRRRLIDTGRASAKMEPGLPPGAPLQKAGVDATEEVAGTTHLSVIDARGNAVALTSSVEAGFGSGLMASGFLLNNQLTDFSFRSHDAEGAPIANAVAPGKRPRSSMAPTIVFDPGGRVFAVLGSPGGARIPLYVIKTAVGLIDWRLDAQAAVDLPNFGSRNGPMELEKDVAGQLTALQMRLLGHEVRLLPMTSGTHLIVRRSNGALEGGADPRREGLARGD